MAYRINVTLTKDINKELKSLPRGVKAILIRKLLEGYMRFRDEKGMAAFSIITEGKFELEEKK